MDQLKIIGTSPVRIDALEKVTGAAKYAGDYRPDRAVWARLVVSTHAHANILSIDASEALALPGVLGVLTGADVPEIRTGGYLRDRHILCKKEVRYVGDYVALVVAHDELTAAKAAALVHVEYEELPAVLSVKEAMKPDPIRVHEDVGSYLPTGFQDIEEFGQDPNYPNLFSSYAQVKGDVEKGFAEADVIVENDYSIPFVSHCTMETHSCVVIPEENGDLTIYASEQKGSTAKYEVAGDLGLNPAKIHFHIPYLGGGFGGKTSISVTDLAAVAAMKYGCPVRMVMTREESFTSGGLRGAADLHIKDGYMKDGTLVARQVEALCNGGAYSTHSAILVMCAGEGAIGNYRVPNLMVETKGIYTNTPPTAPYRALGSEYFVFAIERNMDEAAKKLGIDRAEIRLKNVITDGEFDGDDHLVENNGSRECLLKTLKAFDVNKKRPPQGPWYFGRGLSLGNKFVGVEDPAGTGALVKIEDDGSAVICISHVEMGQGALTVDAMAAAEELKLPYDKIRIVFGDSDICPHDMGTFCSRGTYVNGNAIKLACREAVRKMLEAAAAVMELPADELDTENGRIFEKANPEHFITIPDLFTGEGSVMEGGHIMGSATWHHPNAFEPYPNQKPMTFSYGAWGIEVAVNSETGEVVPTELAGCYDAGRVVNIKACQGQIEGAFSMGLGQAIFEEVMLNDAGRVINGNFRDYKIPTFMDGPSNGQLRFGFLEDSYNPYGPNGAKGIGEVANIPVLPAIANAVSDAIGAELYRLPFTRENVLKAIKEKQA